MKVAILGTRGYPYVYGGYETFVSRVAPGLAEKGFEVTVYCHRGLFRDRPAIVNGVRLAYVPAIEHKVLSQFTHSFLSTIHALASGHDILLFVNTANGPFGLLAKWMKRKTVMNTDGLEWLRPKWKGFGEKYFRWASALSARVFDVLVADAVAMQDIYQREFGRSSVVIAYGADVIRSVKPELLSKFGLTAGDYYLVVGRLVPDNNADIIIREFLATSSKRKLVVVGDVPYEDPYARRVKAMGNDRVVFTGYICDVEMLNELYCNAFAYIHGHEFGGTNPTLLKAMASGSAILALNTVFNREVLAGDKHGLYFEKTPGDLAIAIRTTEEQPERVALLKKGIRERVQSEYNWPKIIDQYAGLLVGMIPHSGPN